MISYFHCETDGGYQNSPECRAILIGHSDVKIDDFLATKYDLGKTFNMILKWQNCLYKWT